MNTEPSNVRPLDRAGNGGSTGELAHAAAVLKAMAHPIRLVVICGLLRQPSTLTEISIALSIPSSTMAQHLNVLRHAGIIRGARLGREVRFSVVDDSARSIMSLLCRRFAGSPSWSDLASHCTPGDLHAEG
ncbi:MAG: metalloregulator ArsR/SmtB family transcription factor [Candidatus Eisenbacteria bacterium]|jgi:DNA-binding transcriptional ArsR family regulator|nr:metalloregulator ArsR/SmtB family transcription factor [Candidatus Eisenbacteria bacterium]